MFRFLQTRKIRSLEKRLAEAELLLEAEQRVTAVLTAESESMAQVIARDRARVQAETAELNRRRAEAEGDGQTH